MEKVILGPGIIAYKNALPEASLAISALETSLGDGSNGQIKWNTAKVGEFETNLDHRNASDFIISQERVDSLSDSEEVFTSLHKDVRSSLEKCLDDYMSTYKVRIDWIGAFNFVKYGPGGKFNHHSDDSGFYRCTVSVVGYFNDDYEGGALDFEFFGLKVKPDAGDLIIFPSSYIYSHASLPIDSGTKYAIVIMTDLNKLSHYENSSIYNSPNSKTS